MTWISHTWTNPKVPSALCSQIEGACIHHVHELTQMSNSHVYGHFRFWGLLDGGCVSLVYFLPSLWKTCTPSLNMAHFRGLELLSCKSVTPPAWPEIPTGCRSRKNGDIGKILSAILGHKTISDCRQMQFLFLVLSFVFVSFPKSTIFYLLKDTLLLWWCCCPDQTLAYVFWLMLFVLCFKLEAV